MRILYLTPFDPIKKGSGGFVRSTLVWHALRKLGFVRTIVFDGKEPTIEDERNDILHNPCRYVGIHSLMRHRWLRYLGVVFQRGLDFIYRDRAAILRELGVPNECFDCVVVRYPYIAAPIAPWKIAPMLLDVDDLPSEVFKTLNAPRIKSPLIRWFRYWEAWGLQRYLMNHAVSCWFCNKEHLKHLPRGTRAGCLPNSGYEPVLPYAIYGRQEKMIAMVGAFGYDPNREGVDWFLDTVWEEVLARFPNFNLCLVGSLPKDAIVEEWRKRPNVKLLGFVDNLQDVYERAFVSLAPIRTGSGTCVKVIEAALFGRVTLATPFAVRGLTSEEIRAFGIRVFSTAEEFLAVFQELNLLDSQTMKSMQSTIAEAASVKYSRDAFEKNLQVLVHEGVGEKVGVTECQVQSTCDKILETNCCLPGNFK